MISYMAGAVIIVVCLGIGFYCGVLWSVYYGGNDGLDDF